MDRIFSLKDICEPLESGCWAGEIASTSEGALGGAAMAERMAALKVRYGSIGHQNKVVIKVSNTVETAVAMVAIWSLGGVVIPVKREMPSDSIDAVVLDCAANFLLDPESGDLTPLHSPDMESIEYRSTPRVTGVDLALIIYTSGSTGKPKGIMLTHANVVSALRSILSYLNIGSSDILMSVSPLSFDYGLYQVLFSMATGCKLILYNESVNPIKLVQRVNEYKVSVLPLVPSLASSLHKYLFTFKKTVSSVRLVTSTGGYLPDTTVVALRNAIPGVSVYKMYGLTESKRVSFLPPSELDEKGASVGKPMPGLDAKIFEEVPSAGGKPRLVEMMPGSIGQLYVRGASVFQQYYGNCDAGAYFISGSYRDDNWLATGDLFVEDEDGYLYFKGRVKELIKQGGYCLYPKDIESIVFNNPDVENCRVIGVPDRDGNEQACLCVVLRDSSKPKRDVFKQWLNKEIDVDYRPRDIKCLDEMPLSSHGKIDVSALKAMVDGNQTPSDLEVVV